MNLKAYKATITSPILPKTVTFLLKETHVLLGFKKSGFGKGNYLGIGGKVENDETIMEAAIREIHEEIHIVPSELVARGTVTFYFPKESWNQIVHIFVTKSWKGEPKESDEIRPEWFPIHTLPSDKMWDDAKYWIPQILDGKTINQEFLFNEELLVIDTSLNR